jgi:hypothetical protein
MLTAALVTKFHPRGVCFLQGEVENTLLAIKFTLINLSKEKKMFFSSVSLLTNSNPLESFNFSPFPRSKAKKPLLHLKGKVKGVTKLLKTYKKFIESINQTDVCMAILSASNQVKKQSQQMVNVDQLKALVKRTVWDCNLQKLQSSLDFQIIGRPLLIDHEPFILHRRQLIKRALSLCSIAKWNSREHTYLLGVLIRIQQKIFFINSSELKQRALLQKKPETVACALVHHRLKRLKFRSLYLKTARLLHVKQKKI